MREFAWLENRDNSGQFPSAKDKTREKKVIQDVEKVDDIFGTQLFEQMYGDSVWARSTSTGVFDVRGKIFQRKGGETRKISHPLRSKGRSSYESS